VRLVLFVPAILTAYFLQSAIWLFVIPVLCDKLEQAKSRPGIALSGSRQPRS